MGKYKVCVYAISKNESKFVKRWVDSMCEADEIYVLDTGSTDDTVKKLAELGVNVKTKTITPWRFDTARNESLSLVPYDTDICVCTDLDEVFHKGWRDCLEKIWDRGALRAEYRYTWNFNSDGSEGVVFNIDKIHSRNGYKWINPVHEVLKWCGNGAEPLRLYADGIQLDHLADPTKSRSQYLPLLELAVNEDPENDRNMHYLGREYMFYGKLDKSIETLKRHLSLKNAVWQDERCASMRYIAACYTALGNKGEAERWYLRAVAEAPHLREPYIEYAKFALSLSDWNLIVFLTERALKIKERPVTYITTAESWGALPYDLASLGYYYTGRYSEADKAVNKAIELSPDDLRLKENKKLISEKL